jgi:arylsulfatase A-like enzyme
MPAPNVLLISTDQWPGSLLGCYGHPSILTPTIDQLAINGRRYTNAYSECPVCVPARRTLITGLTPHSHGMLSNSGDEGWPPPPLPETPTLAEAFRDAGYQTCAVGKMHWHPQRQHRGFEELLLDEEGRGGEGIRADDYELFLGDQGHPGERYTGGMSNNAYLWRPWHLEERLHVTNWTAREMSRKIIRRDPTRPGFWYCSFSHPHPPLDPLQAYLDIYRDLLPTDPVMGEWSNRDLNDLPPALQRERQALFSRTLKDIPQQQIRAIHRAFYALCTHIDHQIRVVIGTLREEGLLGNTILCFTSDHGDMLGDHGLWAKHWMYEGSNHVPMIVVGTDEQKRNGRVGHHAVDDRLVATRDIMPTLLDLADVEIPEHCEGYSMVGDTQHPQLFGACSSLKASTSQNATRMLRTATHKLIYYPYGNLVQVFDMIQDREECHDLAAEPEHQETVAELTESLIRAFPEDERAAWAPEGVLRGIPHSTAITPAPNTWFDGQRGLQWPSKS